jgi:ActR/RegA family two-component response regulator
MMELNRALENRSLAVSTVQEKGRSLFTNRDFYPGFFFSL